MGSLTVAMQNHLRSPYRTMAWLAWFERPGTDLYVWSGSHTITWDGNEYRGYGYLSSIDTIRKGEGTEHIEQVFELSGIDPAILADLDGSVRGLRARIWLAGIGNDRQVIRDPILISDLMQDTLGWNYAQDGSSVTLRLTTFDALPLLGKINGGKWSNEDQLERFANDSGFKYNAPIALQGPPVQWQQAEAP